MNLSQDRTEEIKRELIGLHNVLKMTIQKAIRIGELLTEQKDFVGHGKFIEWVESNLNIGRTQAWRFMKVFEYQSECSKLEHLKDAYYQIETLEKQEKMSRDERDRNMIIEFSKTGIKPIGWTDKLDKRIQDSEKGYAKQRERIDKHKEEIGKRKEAFMDPLPDDEKAGHYYRLGKLTEEMLNNASTTIHTKTTERANWKEKIRLSAGGKEDAFMDAIIDYMETLSDDNRRIEACNNIIKICRNISVELQKAR